MSMSAIKAQYELVRLFTMYRGLKRAVSSFQRSFDRSVWSGMPFKTSEQACVEWIAVQFVLAPRISEFSLVFDDLDRRIKVWTWQPVAMSVRADIDISFAGAPQETLRKVQVGPGKGKTIWVGINSWGAKGQRVWERRTKADVIMKGTGATASFAVKLTNLESYG